jgi:hypothetical protein
MKAGDIMLKKIALIMVFVAGLSMVAPTSGYSWGYGYYYPYRGCYGGCGYNNGWGVAAVVAGGLIAAVLIGSIIADRPVRPPAAYPDAVVSAGQGPLAYPDPEFIEKYGRKGSAGPKSGEWVTVPGQDVNGAWVPEHQVWISNQPE